VSFQRSGVSTRGIGFELERLRRAAGLTLKDVGRGLGVSEATVSRLENGKRDTTSEEVASILTILGVMGEERARLIAQARGTDSAGLLVAPYSPQTQTYQAFEQTASKIINFELTLIPGVVQTKDYARAVIAAAQFHESAGEIEARVARRVARQAVRTLPNPPELVLILTEAALRLPLGGRSVMAQQVRHLIEVATQPKTTLQVIPSEVVSHPGLTGPFVIMDFDNAPTIVCIEARASGTFLDNPATVQFHRLVADRLLEVSLDVAESIRLMTSVAEELSRPEVN
jgi:transcriptional regulator with XRE-family HTH domain